MQANKALIERINNIPMPEFFNRYHVPYEEGRNFRCCFPNHGATGKTPSMRYYPLTNSVGCFGCKKGGGPIHFVMNMEGIPFGDAVKLIMKWYNIEELPDFSYKQYASKLEAKENRYNQKLKWTGLASLLQRINVEDPDDLFRFSYLYCNLNVLPFDVFLKSCMNYKDKPLDEFIYSFDDGVRLRLKEDMNLINEFRPHNFSTLRQFDQFSINAGFLEEAPERWKEIENRFVFPVFLPGKIVVGFSGRTTGNHFIKYMTHFDFGFDKADIMYGLDVALPAIKKMGYVIVCEGILDVLRCRQCGYLNAVAPLSSYLSEEHITILKVLTDNFLLTFDGDFGGESSYSKSTKNLDKSRLLYERISLPKGEDPDSFGRKDPEALSKMLTSKW